MNIKDTMIYKKVFNFYTFCICIMHTIWAFNNIHIPTCVCEREHVFSLSLFNYYKFNHFFYLQMSKHRVGDHSSKPQQKNADWHKGLSDLHEIFSYMLDHNIHTDCTFVVGLEDENTQEFKAHRILLCTASEVFDRMLLGKMREAVTGHVRITDITPHTFHLLLK
jgi:hypothetical protein